MAARTADRAVSHPILSLSRVVLAIPTLGQRGRGRTLGGVRILVGLFVVPPANHREVSHLEGVGLFTAALQRARHTVPHVEVARRNVRCQVQLSAERNGSRSDIADSHARRQSAEAKLRVSSASSNPRLINVGVPVRKTRA